MSLAQYSLAAWQMALIGFLYVGYLCWVMFGGMRKKEAKLRRFVFMIVLLFWALLKTYDGIHSDVELVNLAMIIVIAVVKALYLGRKKHVEKIDGIDYIWHDLSYVAVWFVFFAGKMLLTGGLKYLTEAVIPMWHMVFYFCIYFTLRSVVIVYLHPQAFLRKSAATEK